jgi:branched-chain amino acid aminotransferase
MKELMVYMNGRFVPESEAKISIYDSALMFGDMVFEMTRSFNKKQFKLREHLERLYAGIKILRIPVKMSIEEMEKKVYDTININDPLFNDDDEHRVMIDVTRGALSIYHGVKDIQKEPNIIISDFPLRWTVSSMGPLYDSGINAVITSQRAIPAFLLDPKIKNRSRIHYLTANIEVSNYEGDNNWALLLDPDGFIAEGTGDNFFIVKNNKIITPEGRNILRGISRDYIFELAQQLGLECIEQNIEPYDVYNADEAFMTGTPFCLLPVTGLNFSDIGNGEMGKITNHLLNIWSKNVGVDIVKQIKNYSQTGKIQETQAPSPYRFKK